MKTFKVTYAWQWKTSGRKVRTRTSFNCSNTVEAESAKEAIQKVIDQPRSLSTVSVYGFQAEEVATA